MYKKVIFSILGIIFVILLVIGYMLFSSGAFIRPCPTVMNPGIAKNELTGEERWESNIDCISYPWKEVPGSRGARPPQN